MYPFPQKKKQKKLQHNCSQHYNKKYFLSSVFRAALLFTCLVAHDYRPVTLVTLAVSIICSSLFIVRCFAPVLAQLTALCPRNPIRCLALFLLGSLVIDFCCGLCALHMDQYFYKWVLTKIVSSRY